MINYKQAKKILIKSKIKIKDEFIDSSKSINRVNILDIYSTVNYPAGTNAAFDESINSSFILIFDFIKIFLACL